MGAFSHSMSLGNLLQGPSTRRHFFGKRAYGLGMAALASLMGEETPSGGLAEIPHFAPKAKRVVYLFQSGAPSQIDLLEYKTQLQRLRGQDLPDSVRQGQRLTAMTASQTTFPIAPSMFRFQQHGESGTWISELLPHTARIADRLCVLRSMHTEAINHDPAVTFFQTGAQLAGRPSIGAWISYGLGSVNRDLPGFVVMVSSGTGRNGQPLYDRLWGSGFLPTRYQGVKFRSNGDPVLFLSDPNGIDRNARRRFLDDLGELNQIKYDDFGDPEILARVSQYEMAFRMQASVPELADLSGEPDSSFSLYGPDSRKPGTFAANCLLARRLLERDVRFVQLFHRGWDQHTDLPEQIRKQCADTDQASAALVTDLAQRGLLDDTLVVWGGEFGRTVYSQGKLTADNYGRDHHPRCFSMWLAGAGIKAGTVIGETDDFSYNITRDPVHVHDLHATVLHMLGIDHEKLTFKYQGRHFRLTDVHGKLVRKAMA